jgi:hypothetical protein
MSPVLLGNDKPKEFAHLHIFKFANYRSAGKHHVN